MNETVNGISQQEMALENSWFTQCEHIQKAHRLGLGPTDWSWVMKHISHLVIGPIWWTSTVLGRPAIINSGSSKDFKKIGCVTGWLVYPLQLGVSSTFKMYFERGKDLKIPHPKSFEEEALQVGIRCCRLCNLGLKTPQGFRYRSAGDLPGRKREICSSAAAVRFAKVERSQPFMCVFSFFVDT